MPIISSFPSSGASDASKVSYQNDISELDAQNVQAAIDEVNEAKQDKLTGTPGQLIGIGDDGTAQATVYPSNKNLLVDWYFVGGGSQQGSGQFPVNRRGKTKYTTSGQTIDRWAYSGYGSVEIASNGIIIQKTSDYLTLSQPIENPKNIAGKQITLSVLGKGNFYISCYENGIYRKNVTLNSPTITLVHYTIDVSKSVSTLEYQIIANDNNPNTIIAAKLELGPVQTLVHKEGDTWVLNEIPNYAEQYVICSQYSPITGEFVGSQYSNPDLLDNWYFSRPVNQRGETSYRGPWKYYGIDRWYATGTGLTISVEDGYVHYSQTSNSEYRQELDGAHYLAGQTVTLSLLIEVESGTFNMSIYAADGVGNSAWSSVSGLQLLTVTYTMPATITDGTTYKYPLVRFFGIANAKLYAAKLELGSVQTLAHKEGDTWVLNDPPPNYALELAKCQRYYVYSDRYHCVGCVTQSATEYRMAIQLPVPMRIVPTVSMAGWNGRIASGGYTVRSGNGYSTPNQLQVNTYGKGTSNITVSDRISLQDVVDVNNSIIYYEIADLALNAEL